MYWEQIEMFSKTRKVTILQMETTVLLTHVFAQLWFVVGGWFTQTLTYDHNQDSL